jgi:nitrogen fixation protein FixH
VVIAVNFTMATLAEVTFGGTVVDNSYVASQRFNAWLRDARAQEALGWHTVLGLDGERRVTIAARDGAGPLLAAEVHAVARHPVGTASDRTLAFRPAGDGLFVSETPLPPGRWVVQVEIRRGGDSKRLIESLS